MQIINNNTVVVTTSDELKTVLEEDNNYTYIYFGNNINLTSGITINKNKEKVIIDGTYLNTRYTYTGMNSIENTDVITASPTNRRIIFKNMDVSSVNPFGIIHVPVYTTYKNVCTEYNNIKFNGTEMGFNPYGTIRVIDCNITIEDTSDIEAQESFEADHIEIGGNTIISSDAKNYSLFYFRNDTGNPYIKFLPNSHVNLTSTYNEFMRGTFKLNFTILHDAEVNLVTANGFSFNTTTGATDVLIDERATLNFIENNHQRVPMWNVYGNFTVNNGANVYIINTYDNTPSDNYNIHFKGTNQKLILNNPKSLILYSKNANILYTNNPLNFNFSLNRINMWQNSNTFTNAGGIDNLPDFSWYLKDDFLTIEGTITNSSTSITTHNISNEELATLPDLTNFSFQNRKQLSIGTYPLNIHPITKTSTTISGHTIEFADVMISYDSKSYTVTADENGFFECTIPTPIEDDTKITITVNVGNSFVYKTRTITTPHNGELTLNSNTSSFSFSLDDVTTTPLIFKKSDQIFVNIVDSRVVSSNWKLYAHLSGPLTSANNFSLPNAIIFKKFDNTSVILNEIPTLVLTGINNNGTPEATKITWSKEQGPLLSLQNNALEANEEYNTTLIWSIEE